MASGIDMKVEFPDLKELQRGFRELRPSLSRKYMGAAIRRSLKPAVSALRGNVVRGPTGNLRRAIASKVKSYRSGAAVGLVGFVAAGSLKSKSAAGGSVKIGKDRAFHAGFLEFGTKDRAIKTSSIRGGASIASSFRRLGAFTILPVRGAVLSCHSGSHQAGLPAGVLQEGRQRSDPSPGRNADWRIQGKAAGQVGLPRVAGADQEPACH